MADIGELVVDLPAEVEWTMVIDEATDRTYHREWIPAGTTVEDTELWLIVSQKFDLEKRRSARRFLIDLRKRARTACTDIRYNGPEKIVLEKHALDKYHLDGVPKKFVEKYRSYWGRFFCAEQHGREYGTVTEQRVFAHRNTVFVVTSELRIPPSIYAGVFRFDTRGRRRGVLEEDGGGGTRRPRRGSDYPGPLISGICVSKTSMGPPK